MGQLSLSKTATSLTQTLANKGKIQKAINEDKSKEADNKILANKSNSKGFNAKKFSGKLKGVFGEPLAYQKKVRDEC